MYLIENSLPSDDGKNIDILDQNEDTRIIAHTPVFMYDALGTIITVCDPLKPLKTKEELAIYTLSRLKSYNEQNEEILKKTIHQIGMDDIAKTINDNLVAKGLPKKAIFFALVDIITEEYCKMIGDDKEELRIDVLSKIHKLANPRVFDYVNEYSQKTFNSDISQLILTQDNPIMKEVYVRMLSDYGLDIITVPNKQFDGLKKNNPKLYSKLLTYLDQTPNNVGFYDDKLENINAAEEIGILIELATGIKVDDPTVIEKEAAELINKIFNQDYKTRTHI